MSAMEKVAWTELVVSVVALLLAASLYPWLGPAATSAFALMALIAFGGFFLRQRGKEVVVDERDREIERRSIRIGIGTSWMMLFTALILATLWTSYVQENAVPNSFLNWLIWVQFAVCYGVKGLISVLAYRSEPHAS